MARVLGETTLRRDLIARGYARARTFSWTEAAARTREVYHSVLHG